MPAQTHPGPIMAPIEVDQLSVLPLTAVPCVAAPAHVRRDDREPGPGEHRNAIIGRPEREQRGGVVERGEFLRTGCGGREGAAGGKEQQREDK